MYLENYDELTDQQANGPVVSEVSNKIRNEHANRKLEGEQEGNGNGN